MTRATPHSSPGAVRTDWLHRWDAITRPAVRDLLRDLAVRAIGPAVLVWVVIVATGLFIEGPLGGLSAENAVNRTLADGRTPLWNSITAVWSHIGNTEIVIGVCLVVAAAVWWRTRQWWFAAVPVLAISLQATIFVLATAVVGRDRPDVEKLDPAPPTSSYPSGHVGASTALYAAFTLMVQRIAHPVLRRGLTVLCVVVPLLVTYARLYRGMHHLTDVVVAILNGLVCAALAWSWPASHGRHRDGGGAG